MNGKFIYHLSCLFVLLFTLKNYQVFPEIMMLCYHDVY